MNQKKIRSSYKGRNLSKIGKLFIAALIGLFLSLEGNVFLGSLGLQPVHAQSLRPEQVATLVYQRIPYLPKENSYTNQETGQVDPENTLVSRLIKYHQYIKDRPNIFSLDWKITLADYLGVNEAIDESRYPGSSTLKENPLMSDRTAINNLNRRQRNELVDVLLSIYNPQAASSSTQKTPDPKESSSQPRVFSPQPGGAELLKP